MSKEHIVTTYTNKNVHIFSALRKSINKLLCGSPIMLFKKKELFFSISAWPKLYKHSPWSLLEEFKRTLWKEILAASGFPLY